MNNPINHAWYSQIETLGAVDGPGLRLIIFLQGCPLRCLFCHNPETIEFKEEKKITIDEIINLYKKNESFYKSNSGGITISGGEALAQADFMINLATRTKAEGIHLTVDTALGSYMGRNIEKIMKIAQLADLFLIDVKHPDNEMSIKLTTQGNEKQLDFIKLCESLGTKYWIRHVYVPTFSDVKDEYMIKLGHILGNLRHMEKFEILPYHNMMIPKYQNLGMEFKLHHVTPPSKEQIAKAMNLIRQGIQEVRANPSLSPIYESK